MINGEKAKQDAPPGKKENEPEEGEERKKGERFKTQNDSVLYPANRSHHVTSILIGLVSKVPLSKLSLPSI